MDKNKKPNEAPNQNGMNLSISPEVAKGTYSNLALLTHCHSEFVLDFATILPGMPGPEVVNRIIMAPEHAKRLLLALQDNVRKYESTFGEIDLGEAKERKPKATFNLGDLGVLDGPKS